MNKSTDSWNR